MGFHIPEQEPTPYVAVLEIARTAPRVADNDPRIAVYKERGSDAFIGDPIMWGNNFFMLWMSLREGANDSLVKVYRERALARTGFTELLDNNQPLVHAINSALDTKRPADILQGKYMDLINRGIEDEDMPTYMELAMHIDEQVGHPMGVTAVSLHAWDTLTPLLHEIAGRMDEAGIPHTEFCG